MNYLDLVRYLAVNNLNPSPLGYVGGSDVFGTFNAGAAQGIAAAVNAFPRGAGRMLAIMHAMDGALATVAPGATAFPWRRTSALVQWYVETGDAAAATNWLASAHQAVATVFGRRLRELHRGESAGVAVLRPESVPAHRRSAEVRSGPNHVLRLELLTPTVAALSWNIGTTQ